MSALQKGEKVLITGGTGFIGSHIVHEALAAGLKVKMAIRNEEKAKTVIDALEKIHGSGHIETVIVKDFGAENAYDEAIKGVQGVVHTASDLTFSANPDDVIPSVVKAYTSLMEAAHSQDQIRRIILTSSSIACNIANVGGKTTQHVNTNSWNDASVEQVKTAPNPMNVYAASKVLSERVAWDFVKEKNPKFIVNTINPNFNMGASVPGIPTSSSGKAVVDAATGKPSFIEFAGNQFHVDVDDVAKLHVIALTREDVKNERILAYKTAFNYNTIIDLIKKLKPDAKVPEKKPEWGMEDNTIVDVARADELLKEQGGLHDLEYSVRRNLQDV